MIETTESTASVSESQTQAKKLNLKALINNPTRYAVQKSPLVTENSYQHRYTAMPQTSDRETQQVKSLKINSIYQNLPSAREETHQFSTRTKDYPQSARTHTGQQNAESLNSLSAPFAINISKKNLDKLPPQMLRGGLSSLVFLDISSNKFTALPEEILQLANLKTLKLDHNFLTKLPMDISRLTCLENLSVSNNLLTALPKSIAELKNTLTVLNVGKNKIESLPNEIGELQFLRALWINNNSFSAIPNTLDLMVSLREFALEWFKYTNPPMASVQNDKSRIVIEQLFRLCRDVRLEDVNQQISFTRFIEHFSMTDGPSLIYAKDSHNRNLLHIAALEEEVGIVKHLLKDAPELANELDQDQQTPLSLAIREDSFSIAKAIINNGGDPNIGGGAFGSSLHLAITKLNIELVKDLLKHSARPNEVDIEGNTPLHLLFSIFSKNVQVSTILAQTLLAHGADPNAQNNDSWAPMHLTVRRGHIEGLRWMLKYNDSNPEIKFLVDAKGGADQWTPLHLAVNLGHYEMVSMLIDHGADLSVRTKTGKSVRGVCMGNFFMTKLLMKGEKDWLKQHIFKEPEENHHHLQKNLLRTNQIEPDNEIMSLSIMKGNSEGSKGQHAKDKKKASFFRPVQRSTSAFNGFNEGIKFIENKRLAVPKNDTRALEDSTTCDGDEQTSRDYAMKETSSRVIPRSPNNIQKLQVAQSYRSYLKNQVPTQNLLIKSTPDLISQVMSSGIKVNQPLITFSALNPLRVITESKGIKTVHRHSQSIKSQKQVLQGKPLDDSPQKVNPLKMANYPEASGYIHNFTSCNEEIKKFQNKILDEGLELSERLKYVFYLKVLHLKIEQRIQKLNSQFMPLELFIISEFLDDEVKRERFLNAHYATSNQMVNDVAPRALLFAFENLRASNSFSNNLLKSELCLAFAQIAYPSSKHFIEHMIKTAKTIPKNVRKEAVSALRTLENITVQETLSSHRENNPCYTEPNDVKNIQTHPKVVVAPKNPKKRAESMDQTFKSMKSTKANTIAEAENLMETEGNQTTPRTLMEAQNMQTFNNTRSGGINGRVVLFSKLHNPGQNRYDPNEEDALGERFGLGVNKNGSKQAGQVMVTHDEVLENQKSLSANRQEIQKKLVGNYNMDEGHPKKTNQITITPKSARMNNYFSLKY